VPVGLIALLAADRLIPESRSETARRLDLVGVALATLTLGLVMIPAVEGRELGWPAWTFVCFAAAPIAAALFVAAERRITARRGADHGAGGVSPRRAPPLRDARVPDRSRLGEQSLLRDLVLLPPGHLSPGGARPQPARVRPGLHPGRRRLRRGLALRPPPRGRDPRVHAPDRRDRRGHRADLDDCCRAGIREPVGIGPTDPSD